MLLSKNETKALARISRNEIEACASAGPTLNPKTILQTPPLQMMNFSAARKGGELQGPEEPAWTVGLHDAFVGYEGLVFDRERAFDPDAGEFSCRLCLRVSRAFV